MDLVYRARVSVRVRVSVIRVKINRVLVRIRVRVRVRLTWRRVNLILTLILTQNPNLNRFISIIIYSSDTEFILMVLSLITPSRTGFCPLQRSSFCWTCIEPLRTVFLVRC